MIDKLKRALLPAYCFYNRIMYGMRNEWTLTNFVIRQKYKENFRVLKNIHKGERCFIIGNGPSLTISDLDMLKDEYTFAANRIYFMFDKTKWRPTYYCAQDSIVIDDIKEKFVEVLPECKKMFLIRTCYKKVPKVIRDSKDVLFYCVRYKQSHKELKFCEDISCHISGGSTITYAAMQIAAYMGFKEIYLLGVDHNYALSSNTKGNKFAEKEVKASYFEGMPTNIKLTVANTDASTLSFIKAKEYCDAHDIKIINATRGGKLEVYPRMQLEKILSK